MCPQQCKRASLNLLRGCTQQKAGGHHIFIRAGRPKQEHGFLLLLNQTFPSSSWFSDSASELYHQLHSISSSPTAREETPTNYLSKNTNINSIYAHKHVHTIHLWGSELVLSLHMTQVQGIELRPPGLHPKHLFPLSYLTSSTRSLFILLIQGR